jgi:hypothetical protein
MSVNGFVAGVLKVGFGNGPLFPFNAQATQSGGFRGVQRYLEKIEHRLPF